MAMNNQMQPLFSVIISAYGRQELLNEAVHSIIDQTETSWELIIVDDCSPTPLTVDSDPRVVLLRNNENLGWSGGANRALSHARGAYLAFLGDDDRWTKERLANAKLGHDLGADLVVCRSVTLDDGVDQHGLSDPSISLVAKDAPRPTELLDSICATSIRREICPDFDLTYRANEDVEWAIRLDRERPVEARVESPDFLWRRHGGARNLNGTDVRIENSKRLLIEHAPYYDVNGQAHAFRLFRIGQMHLSLGDSHASIVFAMRSLGVRPNRQAARLLIRGVGSNLRVRMRRRLAR